MALPLLGFAARQLVTAGIRRAGMKALQARMRVREANESFLYGAEQFHNRATAAAAGWWMNNTRWGRESAERAREQRKINQETGNQLGIDAQRIDSLRKEITGQQWKANPVNNYQRKKRNNTLTFDEKRTAKVNNREINRKLEQRLREEAFNAGISDEDPNAKQPSLGDIARTVTESRGGHSWGNIKNPRLRGMIAFIRKGQRRGRSSSSALKDAVGNATEKGKNFLTDKFQNQIDTFKLAKWRAGQSVEEFKQKRDEYKDKGNSNWWANTKAGVRQYGKFVRDDALGILKGYGKAGLAAGKALGKPTLAAGKFMTGDNVFGKSMAAIGDMMMLQRPTWNHDPYHKYFKNKDKAAKLEARRREEEGGDAAGNSGGNAEAGKNTNVADAKAVGKIEGAKAEGQANAAAAEAAKQAGSGEVPAEQKEKKKRGRPRKTKDIGGKIERANAAADRAYIETTANGGARPSGGGGGFTGGFGGFLSGAKWGGGGGGFSGGLSKVEVVSGAGIQSIVHATSDVRGAVDRSSDAISRALTGSSRMLQDEFGKFKAGNPGGKSSDVREAKKLQQIVGTLVQEQSSTTSAIQQANPNQQLAIIGSNTSPDNQLRSASFLRGALDASNTLLRMGNTLQSGTNKYLAIIMKLLGWEPDRQAPRRFKALLGIAGITAVGGVITEMKKRMPDAKKWANDKIEKVKSGYSGVKQTAVEKADAVASNETVKETAKVMSEEFEQTSMGQDMGGAFESLGRFAKAIKEMDWRAMLGELWGGIKKAWHKFIGLFSMEKFRAGFAKMLEIFDNLYVFIKENLLGAFNTVVTFFKSMLGDEGGMSKIWERLKEVFAGVMRVIQPLINAIVSFGKLLGLIAQGFWKVAQGIVWVIGKVLAPVIKGLANGFLILTKIILAPIILFAKAIEGIVSAIYESAKWLKEKIVGMWDWLADTWLGRKMGMGRDNKFSSDKEREELNQRRSENLKLIDIQTRTMNEIKNGNKQRATIEKRRKQEEDRKFQREMREKEEQRKHDKERDAKSDAQLAALGDINDSLNKPLPEDAQKEIELEVAAQLEEEGRAGILNNMKGVKRTDLGIATDNDFKADERMKYMTKEQREEYNRDNRQKTKDYVMSVIQGGIKSGILKPNEKGEIDFGKLFSRGDFDQDLLHSYGGGTDLQALYKYKTGKETSQMGAHVMSANGELDTRHFSVEAIERMLDRNLDKDQLLRDDDEQKILEKLVTYADNITDKINKENERYKDKLIKEKTQNYNLDIQKGSVEEVAKFKAYQDEQAAMNKANVEAERKKWAEETADKVFDSVEGGISKAKDVAVTGGKKTAEMSKSFYSRFKSAVGLEARGDRPANALETVSLADSIAKRDKEDKRHSETMATLQNITNYFTVNNNNGSGSNRDRNTNVVLPTDEGVHFQNDMASAVALSRIQASLR